jgi:hypothetical protein
MKREECYGIRCSSMCCKHPFNKSISRACWAIGSRLCRGRYSLLSVAIWPPRSTQLGYLAQTAFLRCRRSRGGRKPVEDSRQFHRLGEAKMMGRTAHRGKLTER